jgi:predicted chitinase
MIDRKIFFNAVRPMFGGKITASQFAGMIDMLDIWDKSGFTDLRWFGYILGGVYHEVGKRMVPVREGFATTDAGARAVVAKLFKAGKISRNYALPNKAGVSFYGRGRIQTTWEENYRKLERRFGYPFTKNPDLLLDSVVDARVTLYGHVEGLWTGKKLSDYFNDRTSDWKNARRIVNGTDRADLIAGYGKAFHEALVAARVADPVPLPPVVEPAEPRTTYSSKTGAYTKTGKIVEVDAMIAFNPEPRPVEPVGFWTGLWRAIAGWFG